MLTWKIAWRNVWRHKGKSLVVGVILFLGMVLMVVGNAVTEGARQGLKANLADRFSGELLLVSSKQKRDDVFLAPHKVELIHNYAEMKLVLEQQDGIASFLPIARGMTMIMNEDGITSDTMTFGVNFEAYQEFFYDNVMAFEGELLSGNDRGVLISDETRKYLFQRQRVWIVPEGSQLNEEHLTPDAKKLAQEGKLRIRHDLVILGRSEDSLETDIRLPVKGIFQFARFNKVWGLFNYMFLDIESYRQAFGHLTTGDRSADLTKAQETMLAIDDAADMFADMDVTEDVAIADEGFSLKTLQQQTERTGTLANAPVNFDEGAYSVVLIKLQPGVSLLEAQTQLTKALDDADLGIRVATWKKVMGDVFEMTTIMQGALFMFVFFVFFVAIIIIMNTLSMAAMERTGEIGMMRAIGAPKRFISQMFLTETAQLSAVFGGAGILFGIILVMILGALNLPLTGLNEFASLLLGGDTFQPILRVDGMVLGIVQLVVVTLLAVIYPVLVARKITPLEAISRD